METLTVVTAPDTAPTYPRQYSQHRCPVCTQYHGQQMCDPAMVAHLLRNV